MVEMRTFIAVDLESNEVKKEISNIQQSINKSGADLKLVSPENLHFTLRFLGEITEKEFEMIRERLKQIEFPSFKISYRGLGIFPNERRISVIWIGVDQGREELIKITEAIGDKLLTLNFRPDKKFLPHLTISRVRSGRNKEELIRSIEPHMQDELGDDIVSSIRIKKSDLTPKGPVYTDMFTLPLKKVE
jgi:2'-5' RNA ligase